ncbi:MAG: pirin family protein, partial [Bacteroidia bacterium]
YRSVQNLLYAEKLDMGGFPVRQPFPTHKVDQIDPFLLLHHADIKVPDYTSPKHAGVGPHPHRGFSAVTFIFKGGVHHQDSRGNNSTVYEGGTQWMHAGMGTVHSERPPHDIHEIGGRQEIIQLWINSPQKHKMGQPGYAPLSAEKTPTITTNDDKVKIAIVAGEFDGKKGAVNTLSPVLALRPTMQKGGEYYFPIPENYNAFLYLLDGKITLADYGLVDDHNLVYFRNDGEGIHIKAEEDTRMLLMAGEPLNEPIARQGPFVMNTQTEILQAMRDYQMGKMGILIEE